MKGRGVGNSNFRSRIRFPVNKEMQREYIVNERDEENLAEKFIWLEEVWEDMVHLQVKIAVLV